MADHSEIVPEDPTFVRLNQARELRYWCEKFSVTPQALGEAVIQVGSSSARVAAYLRRETGPRKFRDSDSGSRVSRELFAGTGVFLASCFMALAALVITRLLPAERS
jgi:hypothetical protein